MIVPGQQEAFGGAVAQHITGPPEQSIAPWKQAKPWPRGSKGRGKGVPEQSAARIT